MKTTPVQQSLKTETCLYQKPVRDVDELKQHLIETWSATNIVSLIKRLINGEIVLMRAVSKPKTNTLNIYNDVLLRNFMTFKYRVDHRTENVSTFARVGNTLHDVMPVKNPASCRPTAWHDWSKLSPSKRFKMVQIP